jgi:hypothetical protein
LSSSWAGEGFLLAGIQIINFDRGSITLVAPEIAYEKVSIRQACGLAENFFILTLHVRNEKRKRERETR